MKNVRGVVLPIVILTVLIPVAFIGREFLFNNLIQPVARMVWLIFRSILAVDQVVYWTLLIVAAGVIGIRLIPGLQNPPTIPKSYTSSRLVDRTAYWNELILTSASDQTRREELQHELEKLSDSVESTVDGSQRAKIELPAVKLGAVNLIRHFLTRSMRASAGPSDTELNRSIESILRSLDSQLETNYDGKSIEHTDE